MNAAAARERSALERFGAVRVTAAVGAMVVAVVGGCHHSGEGTPSESELGVPDQAAAAPELGDILDGAIEETSDLGAPDLPDLDLAEFDLAQPDFSPPDLRRRQLSFAAPVDYVVGGGPYGPPAIADFNRDGYPDIAVSISSGGAVLLGGPGGAFRPGVALSTLGDGRALASGDFNGDGNADLAVVTTTVNSANIFLGNGDGTFGSATRFATGLVPSAISASDVNADGNLDLVVGHLGDDGILLLFGSGTGSFTPAAARYPAGRYMRAMLPADFNHDGHIDIAVSSSTDGIAMLFGAGDGSLGSTVLYRDAYLANSFGAATVDINRDGNLDIVAALQGANRIAVRIGHADGTLETPASYAVSDSPTGVAIADYDLDGELDVACCKSLASEVGVLLGVPGGTFEQAATFASGRQPFSIAYGDFDRDGLPDLVVAHIYSNTVSVLLNRSY